MSSAMHRWKYLMPCAAFGLLAGVIMLPLLWPGFILTLDLVFTPHLPWPSDVKNTYLLEIVLWALNQFLPGDVLEKIILFAILLLSGVGMYRLMIFLSELRTSARVLGLPSAQYWQWGAYFAGLFYMINPFIYARFMAGQWLVLLGYALLPFFVQAVLRLIVRPSWRTSVWLAVWMFLITSVSIHHSGMLLLVLLVAFGVVIWYNWRRPERWQRITLAMLASGVLALLASSFWIIPALSGSIGNAAQSFNEPHFAGFATLNHGIGAIGHVLRLQGFWAEGYQLFILPQAVVPLWGVLAVGLWVLAGYGAVKGLQWYKALTVGALIVGGVAVILAATPLIRTLSAFIPFIGGYREPHKFVNLLVLVFSVLGGIGAASLLYKTRKKSWALLVMAGLFVFPLVFTPTMFGSFAGQLRPRAYPANWTVMNEYLQKNIGEKRVLFLPWYQYMKFDFAGRTIANPADKYFAASVIVSDNMAFKDVPPTIPDEEKAAIARTLQHPSRLKSELIQRDIHYILLSRERTDQNYDFLKTLPGVKLIKESQTLLLYKIEDKSRNNNI